VSGTDREKQAQGVARLREAAGLFPLGERGVLRVTGADRLKYLHSMLTNGVAQLSPGMGRFAFALTVKGKVVAACQVQVHDDYALVETDAACKKALLEHLKRFIVINQVTFEDATASYSFFGVEGPRAVEALCRATSAAETADCEHPAAERLRGLTLDAHLSLNLADTEVTVTRFSVTGAVGFRVLCAREASTRVSDALASGARQTGGGPVDRSAVETGRVEWGWPIWGREITTGTLPAHLGLDERSVSYTKGCYLGQEPVSMLRFRGRVNKRLVGLALHTGATVPPLEAAVHHEDKLVGVVTSACWSPDRGEPFALALLKAAATEPGTPVEVLAAGAVSSKATVCALPRADAGAG
jgi:folate-binding protein YgfZ